jgi:hypothetical protein
VFTRIRGTKERRGASTRGHRSEDKGTTWSKRETIISDFQRGSKVDPDDEQRLFRDISPGGRRPATGAAYVVWQDLRFGPRSSIAFSQSRDGGPGPRPSESTKRPLRIG